MKQYYSPLRYPGGKHRLTPFIRELIVENDLTGGHYVEPYAGGAGVALALVLNDYVSHVHLNDISLPVYAFWRAVLDFPDELCRLITDTPINVDEWKRRRTIVQNATEYDLLELGFSTLYLNRCNRSGVLNGGLIGGLAQSGVWKMDARFPKEEIIRRIQMIAERRDAITLHNWDAEQFLLQHVQQLPQRTLVYCDPPYVNKANRLYLNHYRDKDHERVANVVQQHLARRWIVSYDYAPQVLDYYGERRLFSYRLQYNASKAYKGRELLIFSDDLVIPLRSSLPFIDSALKKWRTEALHGKDTITRETGL